jgi:small subunit ribosomal protein S16
MLKIKLYPTGKKNQIRYRIVVAEDRSKLNGKYIAALGYYDPLTNPSTISLNKIKYNDWLKKGAQPTKTIRLLVKKA